jgi:uroporphyrinogen-III decarboxylase
MNPRERYLAALLYGKPDRVPLEPGHGRKSTRETWYKQGLPQDVKNIPEYAYRQAGGKLDWPQPGEGFPVQHRMIPQFEEKIIERRGDTQIVQDWKGNICEISSQYTLEYLRDAIDFVTRRWIKCPVESRADWADMKRRYDPNEPSRLPPDPEKVAARLKNRTWPITIGVSGPFWQLREWLGFENLCMMFYDDPDFVKEMLDFWQEYVAALMERAFKYVVPDIFHISEDMAYKNFSMISPEIVRKYLQPVYERWAGIVRKYGCPIYAVDSDGYVGELIPIWVDSGLNACDPVEVAAGNDLVAYHKKFGRTMAYRGGVDKRAMAKGGKVIEDEINRLMPVIKGGGYIPGCDHGIPPDVSWPNFVYYVKLLAQATGWL